VTWPLSKAAPVGATAAPRLLSAVYNPTAFQPVCCKSRAERFRHCAGGHFCGSPPAVHCHPGRETASKPTLPLARAPDAAEALHGREPKAWANRGPDAKQAEQLTKSCWVPSSTRVWILAHIAQVGVPLSAQDTPRAGILPAGWQGFGVVLQSTKPHLFEYGSHVTTANPDVKSFFPGLAPLIDPSFTFATQRPGNFMSRGEPCCS
jgi:hypothetical protein